MSAGEPGVSNPAFWEGLYQSGQAGWDIGGPAPPLARWLAEPQALAPGSRVAVLGCGLGHEALLFARAGHRVAGFDFAPRAVSAARARAAAEGLAVTFEQADIFSLGDRYAGAFDLVVEHTCYCAIDPLRRPEYVGLVHRLLASGGQLVGLFYCHGRPGGPPFTTCREELERLFGACFSLFRLELAPDSVPSRANQELFALMRKLG